MRWASRVPTFGRSGIGRCGSPDSRVQTPKLLGSCRVSEPLGSRAARRRTRDVRSPRIEHTPLACAFDSSSGVCCSDVEGLKAAGYSCGEAESVGFVCAEAKAGGFSCTEVRERGACLCPVCHHTPALLSQVRNAGYSCLEVEAAGYSVAEARFAGFSCVEVREAGYLEGLKAAGFSCSEARAAGYLEGLKTAGFSCNDARAAGAPGHMCHVAIPRSDGHISLSRRLPSRAQTGGLLLLRGQGGGIVRRGSNTGRSLAACLASCTA